MIADGDLPVSFSGNGQGRRDEGPLLSQDIGAKIENLADDIVVYLNPDDALNEAYQGAARLYIKTIDIGSGWQMHNQDLTKALRIVLLKHDVLVSDDVTNAALILHVETDKRSLPQNTAKSGVTLEEVKISWVMTLPHGEEYGRIDQNNQVLAGTLDKGWGPIAYDIAFAMVEVVRDALLHVPLAVKK
jgi:hypothetical protein